VGDLRAGREPQVTVPNYQQTVSSLRGMQNRPSSLLAGPLEFNEGQQCICRTVTPLSRNGLFWQCGRSMPVSERRRGRGAYNKRHYSVARKLQVNPLCQKKCKLGTFFNFAFFNFAESCHGSHRISLRGPGVDRFLRGS
jgi:hypothetical protein